MYYSFVKIGYTATMLSIVSSNCWESIIIIIIIIINLIIILLLLLLLLLFHCL